MPSTRKPEQHGKKHAQPIQHTPYCTLSEELLEKFGLTERLELQTLKDFLSNTLQYGNESLKSGLENLFDGMEHAVSVYSKLIEEVNMLNNGIISLKLDANEAREQALLAETMTAQRSEVLLNHGFPTPIIRLTVSRRNSSGKRISTTTPHWSKLDASNHWCRTRRDTSNIKHTSSTSYKKGSKRRKHC